jgi:hypothetical protein
MMDKDICMEVVEDLCDILETEPLRIMDSRIDSSAQEVAELLEELGRPLAAERFRAGWKVLRDQFKKSLWNVRAGSKDHAFNPPPKQAVMVAPACLRCHKGVVDYEAKRETQDWMFCAECRALGDGPELASLFEAEIKKSEMSIERMSSNLAYLKQRLDKCQGPH